MNRRRTVLTMIVGALLAVAAFRARAGRPPERADGPTETRARRYAEAQAGLDRALARRDRLRGDVDKLRKAERELRERGDATASAPVADGPDFTNRMSAIMRNALLLQAEETAADLEGPLGLSPEQKGRVHALLVESAERQSKALSESAEGQVEDMARLRGALAGVLTPAQLAAYDAYRREEEAEQEEAGRTHLVDSLKKELQLSDEQAKAALAALAAQPGVGQALLGPIEARTAEEVDTWIDATRVDRRKLAVALQPSLAAPQLLKLEQWLTRREDEARELAGWLRLFAAEPARR